MVNLLLNSGGALLNGKPVVFLTQWKIVGNSEVHEQEIWSCGEYNPMDGKYHILVQPLGGNIADIALTEPLRKVNDVADSIEFPSETEGKALVTRNLGTKDLGTLKWLIYSDVFYTMAITNIAYNSNPNALMVIYSRGAESVAGASQASTVLDNMEYTFGYDASKTNFYRMYIKNTNYNDSALFTKSLSGIELIYELDTPTTELVDAPQIQEAESYSMVISQGGKAVEWSSFETDSE